MEATITDSELKGAKGLRHRLVKTGKRAITLIEAAMVLGLFAFLVGMAMYYYGQSSTSRSVTNGLGELASIQQAVRTLYGGQADYSDIANKALTDTNALPKKMVLASGSIRSTFGGAITVAPATLGSGTQTGAGFSVTFANVPQEACSKMVTQDLGRGLYSVKAGSTTRSADGDPPPFAPTDAISACSAASNSIVWTFAS